MRGAEQREIDGDGRTAAERHDLLAPAARAAAVPCSEEGHVADFVEEQDAAIRLAQQSGLRPCAFARR